MNSPSWPDVTNARETEEKRKGKSKIEKPHSDVDAQNTKTYHGGHRVTQNHPIHATPMGDTR